MFKAKKKNSKIKIIQAFGDSKTIWGLGDDGQVYAWDWITKEWGQ